MSIQPDLFGELEAQEKVAELWRTDPPPCPSCGKSEPNWYLMSTNHGYRPDEEGIGGNKLLDHPIYGRMCTAQYLMRNHIISSTRKPNNEADLERLKARGRELGLDADAIESEARMALDGAL